MENKQDNSKIIFKPFTVYLRVIAIGFGALMIFSNLIAFEVRVSTFILIIIGVFFLVLGLVDNTWIFDIKNQEVIKTKGLLFAPKKTIYKFSEIKRIIVEEFKRKGKMGTFTQIIIEFTDGSKKQIEYDKTRSIEDKIFSAKLLQNFFDKRNEKSIEDALAELTNELLGL